MAKLIKQIRFPETTLDETNDFTNGWSKNLIQDLGSVTQLGIYALPGTRFQINQTNINQAEPLIINGTGIFQIDVGDRYIDNLQLAQSSYRLVRNTTNYIVIDIIYEGGLD